MSEGAPPARRRGWHPTDGLEHDWLEVDGVRRGFWLARAPEPVAPLVLALHGRGTTGENLAVFSGLAQRGPAAGCVVALPDALGGSWYAGSSATKRAAANDVAFLEALVAQLVVARVARPERVTLAGLSNGAYLAERLARHALLPVSTLVLVAGTALAWSRDEAPRPRQRAAVLCVAGSADPLVPYGGGPLGGRGLFARWVRRRREWLEPGDAVAVGVEALASDWALANGIATTAHAEALAQLDLPVTRLSWTAAGAPRVELYRIEGGGHGWPGGPQYLPARLIGPIARDLDTTGLLLEAARR